MSNPSLPEDSLPKQKPISHRTNTDIQPPTSQNNTLFHLPLELKTSPNNTQMNEYFISSEGIEREVITTDITLYLGNDALVRPGVFEVSIQLCLEMHTQDSDQFK